MERRLAAILSLDVVGYSRLMNEDEESTHRAVKSTFESLINPKAAEYHGRIIKLTGDGGLMEFASAVDAVSFAIEVQNAMKERNRSAPEKQRIDYRIGINIGDIIIEPEDIYGDGVNIAVRIEGLAEPGGICIARNVFNQIKNKLRISFRDLGERKLKNISEAIRTYQVIANEKQATDESGASLSLPDKPSIAVLPFDDMSGDPEKSYFGDGLAEDIITTLSKISSLFVIARNSSFAFKGRALDIREVAANLGVRYVLEGSVRHSTNRLRINAQLIDATHGHHLWAERYDRQLTDVFDIQDEMTREIVSALRLKLSDGEQAQIWLRGTSNIAAWGSAMQAMELFFEGSPNANAQARQLFERAIAEDPDYTLATAWIGKTHYIDYRFGYTASPEESLAKAEQFGEKALRQDSNEPYAHNLLSNVRSCQGRHDEAVVEAWSAVNLSPNDAYIKLALGLSLINKGNPEEAEGHIREAMRLNPFHHSYYYSILANALEQLGRDEEAFNILKTAVARDPDYFAGHLRLASLYGLAGQIENAQMHAAEVLRINPRFSLTRAPASYVTANPDFLERFLNGLQAAGLPE